MTQTKKPENVKINMMRVQVVAAEVMTPLDRIEIGRYDDFRNGEVRTSVATVSFNGRDQFHRIFIIDVFEDGSFKIGSSSTVSGIESLEAYGRALAFIKALELTGES